MTDTLIVTTAAAIESWAKHIHEAEKTIALVPTMGNLHEGHLALVRKARECADVVVVSIFVNPAQFARGEDFQRYPRTLERDVSALATVGVDCVFAPEVEEVYPSGEPIEAVFAGPVGDILEGASRPGHFDGVLRVCKRLFSLTSADVAVFGEKDAQQLFLVRRMAETLGQPRRIESVPVVRGDDGLALSSRNSYLSNDDRVRALALPHGLQDCAEQILAGAVVSQAIDAGRLAISREDGVDLDYLEAVDAMTFGPWPDGGDGTCLVLGAISVGGTRLIDNVAVRVSA